MSKIYLTSKTPIFIIINIFKKKQENKKINYISWISQILEQKNYKIVLWNESHLSIVKFNNEVLPSLQKIFMYI